MNSVTKWAMPSFLTAIITMLAITLNNKFLWHLDPEKLYASIALSINFIVMALAGDIAKLKKGVKPNLNSTKLVMLLLACGIIGFTQYLGINLGEDEIVYIAGAAASFITGKGLYDIVTSRKINAEMTQQLVEAKKQTAVDLEAVPYPVLVDRIKFINRELNSYTDLLQKGKETPTTREAMRRYLAIYQKLQQMREEVELDASSESK